MLPGPPFVPVWTRIDRVETTSTNDEVRTRARQGAEAGLVVVAEAQTDGRGRQGRTWHSAAGAGLWVSLLLRPYRLPLTEAGWLTQLAGVAALDAIDRVGGRRAGLKWPNDLILNGRKLGGILVETESRKGEIDFAVIGLGINLHQGVSDFPPELRGRATSLDQELGRGRVGKATREALLSALLTAFSLRLSQKPEAIFAAWREASVSLGHEVSIAGAAGKRTGIARELLPSGGLRIEWTDGSMEVVNSGEIEVTLEREARAGAPS